MRDMDEDTPTESELIQDWFIDEYGERCGLGQQERANTIEKIKSAAKREVLNELCEYFDRAGDYSDLADHWAWEYHVSDEIRDFMNKHHTYR